MSAHTAPESPESPSNRQEAIDALAGGLGCMVWWDLHAAWITTASLRALLDGEGMLHTPAQQPPAQPGKPAAKAPAALAGKYAVPALKPISRLRAACQRWRSGKGTGAHKAQIVHFDEHTVTIGILQNEKISAKKAQWTQKDTLVFDRQAAAWLSTGTLKINAGFVGMADHLIAHYGHKWIRSEILTAELRAMHAISIRSQGGIYFVPQQFAGQLERLGRIVAGVGDSALRTARVSADAASRASVGAAARSSLLERLESIEERVGDWQAKASGDKARRLRSDAAANTIAEGLAIVDEGNLYADALGIMVSDLRGRMDAAMQQVRIMAGLESDPAAVEPATKPTIEETVHTVEGSVRQQYEAMSGDEIAEKCTAWGLSAAGTPAEMRQRIYEFAGIAA